MTRCAPRALVVWHLQHATRENAIKEHTSGLGLEKRPTQKFPANWAYLLSGQLAFNLQAWFKRLVLPPAYPQATIKMMRHHLLNLAGKLVHTACGWFMMLSDQYRYQLGKREKQTRHKRKMKSHVELIPVPKITCRFPWLLIGFSKE
jgi:DDE family transposase